MDSTKICPKCKETKAVAEFHKHKKTYDGLQCYCKACQRIMHAAYTKTDKGRAAMRKGNLRYEASEKGKAKRWDAEQTDTRRVTKKEATARYRKRNPDKEKARLAVRNAVSRKELTPAKELRCVYCGREAIFYHHWHGYEKEHWLDVVPACRRCDRAEHGKIIKIHCA